MQARTSSLRSGQHYLGCSWLGRVAVDHGERNGGWAPPLPQSQYSPTPSRSLQGSPSLPQLAWTLALAALDASPGRASGLWRSQTASHNHKARARGHSTAGICEQLCWAASPVTLHWLAGGCAAAEEGELLTRVLVETLCPWPVGPFGCPSPSESQTPPPGIQERVGGSHFQE